MLVCEGSVTTLWAWALVKTLPCEARRSSTGVCARWLPAKPRASARRVSMVMRTISREISWEIGREIGRDGAGAFAGGGAAASRSPARAAIAVKLHFRIAGGL